MKESHEKLSLMKSTAVYLLLTKAERNLIEKQMACTEELVKIMKQRIDLF